MNVDLTGWAGLIALAAAAVRRRGVRRPTELAMRHRWTIRTRRPDHWVIAYGGVDVAEMTWIRDLAHPHLTMERIVDGLNGLHRDVPPRGWSLGAEALPGRWDICWHGEPVAEIAWLRTITAPERWLARTLAGLNWQSPRAGHVGSTALPQGSGACRDLHPFPARIAIAGMTTTGTVRRADHDGFVEVEFANGGWLIMPAAAVTDLRSRRNDRPTAIAAGQALTHDRLTDMQLQVLKCLDQVGTYGLIDDDYEKMCGLRADSAGKRRLELARKGLVRATDERRLTRRGAMAQVWVISPTPAKTPSPPPTSGQQRHDRALPLRADARPTCRGRAATPSSPPAGASQWRCIRCHTLTHDIPHTASRICTGLAAAITTGAPMPPTPTIPVIVDVEFTATRVNPDRDPDQCHHQNC
jgi:hypothetical protein